MICVENLESSIRQKQPHRKPRYETLREIYPSSCSSEDLFGTMGLVGMHRIREFEEGRELCFLRSSNLQVRRLTDDKMFASLEGALPPGRSQWKLVNYYISPKNLALVLQFLPVSDEMATEAGKYAEAINAEWQDEDPNDLDDLEGCEYCTVFDEEAMSTEILMDKYAVQLELVGSYTIFLAADDGSGEYVRRGKDAKTKKTLLRYVEIAQDTKILEHVLTEDAETMQTINYCI